ncbi:hypothetical protein [Flavobacterium hungaricum]|uniref:Lipoprotein n=1 Tax=Flavobacterium hungaricum TaxID=2082725 RepID=A0ABR9TN22_9FLAO|nr:hypothetical protein [Flavobacterium hungaricum]MBE8726765.1 hypothetical protein [Flavobacterium hungaricum]
MKNAIIKSSIMLVLIVCLGCKKDIPPLLPIKNVDSISTNGFFFAYPYKELYDVLRMPNNETERVLLYRITTKKNINYEIELYKTGNQVSFKFPF